MNVADDGSNWRPTWPWAVGFLALLALAYSHLLTKVPDAADGLSYSCGAEHVSGKVFVAQSRQFGNGRCQSLEAAYEGNYGCKMTVDQKYGMTLDIANIEIGDTIVAAVMLKNNDSAESALIISGADGKQFSPKGHKKQGTWTKVEGSIVAQQSGIYKVYPTMISGRGTVYADNLTARIKPKQGK